MYTNVFYYQTLNSVGGIESFFYYLGKKYGKDFDITVFYHDADAAQVERLQKYIRVKRYRDGTIIRCKRAFVCFNVGILDFIEADEYYQTLHGDYAALGFYPQTHPKIQKYISVSETVRDAYQKGKGADSIVSYNPIVLEKPKKVLNLVSATRLTEDKGLARMEALAEMMEKAGIPFLWTVYTDVPHRVVHDHNLLLLPPRLDVIDYIANADYFVQLSNAEGYCYSVVEALSVGTPVIVTDFKVIHELGVEDGKNGWVLPMDMTSVPLDKIYKGLKRVKYTPLEDRWGELLAPGSPNYQEDLKRIVRVRCKRVYWDIEFKREMEYGETWEIPMLRADKLLDLDLVDLVDEEA